MSTKELVELILLLQKLTPTVAKLIRELLEYLSGKSSDEVLAEADSIFERVKQKAKDASSPGSAT